MLISLMPAVKIAANECHCGNAQQSSMELKEEEKNVSQKHVHNEVALFCQLKNGKDVSKRKVVLAEAVELFLLQ